MSKKPDTEARLFYPDTRFERLARRPGGVSRDVALTRAQAAVDAIEPDFKVWMDRQFDDLNAALMEIDRDPTDKELLKRALHSSTQLRDVCGTMGYELVTFVARTLCDVLEAYIAGATYDREVIQCHSDAFMLSRQEQSWHLKPEAVPEMTQGLLRVVEVASIVPADIGK
jgi:hypothetical protein